MKPDAEGSSLSTVYLYSVYFSIIRYRLPARVSRQSLEGWQRQRVGDEVHRAVGQGEVRAAGVAAAKSRLPEIIVDGLPSRIPMSHKAV